MRDYEMHWIPKFKSPYSPGSLDLKIWEKEERWSLFHFFLSLFRSTIDYSFNHSRPLYVVQIVSTKYQQLFVITSEREKKKLLIHPLYKRWSFGEKSQSFSVTCFSKDTSSSYSQDTDMAFIKVRPASFLTSKSDLFLHHGFFQLKPPL